jgi:uncharacterized protein involved in exopolysaccharide biosynthesis
MINENQIAIEEQGIDLKKWITIFIRNWLLFLLCVVLSLTGAIIFIMVSPPQYELRTNILVNKDNNPLDKSQVF